MVTKVFAPGCALMLYKPVLADKLHVMLNARFGAMEKFLTCCHHDPQQTVDIEAINVCPGCNKRFGGDYEHVSTISLWEILAGGDFFPFPDYNGMEMSIIDACPTRGEEKVRGAIRTLLGRMNIRLVEPVNTGAGATCCGDSFYGLIPVEKVKELMIRRTSEMPADDVVVYCVSCIKSVHIGGKRPHYLIDLLFSDETLPKTFEPGDWHKELSEYMELH
ncbi:MAG: (Fe-S)-binding protein [Bacteroidota bacterium]